MLSPIPPSNLGESFPQTPWGQMGKEWHLSQPAWNFTEEGRESGSPVIATSLHLDSDAAASPTLFEPVKPRSNLCDVSGLPNSFEPFGGQFP